MLRILLLFRFSLVHDTSLNKPNNNKDNTGDYPKNKSKVSISLVYNLMKNG